MKLGTSQIDITPRPGVELSGFAARTQPSTGVLDPLFAKALFLADGQEKLLWIHCDLVGLDRGIVLAFRQWARDRLQLREDQVMLSATHTHSGPCTVRLREAGNYDEPYVEYLHCRLRQAAQAATAQMENCEVVTAEGRLTLAADRRRTASAHTDPRIAGVGFRRKNGDFVAAIVNYPMHAVALGASNRHISADVPGQTALALARQLPGNPVVLITNGACGNLNPPAENVPVAQVQIWGRQIADAIAPGLKSATPVPLAKLRVTVRVVPLPDDTLTVEGIHACADKALHDAKPLAQWGDKYRRAVEGWRATLIAEAKRGCNHSRHEAELFLVGLDGLILLGVNAEIFSEFTDWLRRSSSKPIYLLGYANGDLGYLPTLAAYGEGGYEVDVAHFFCGGFRLKAGGLELLAQKAVDLLRAFESRDGRDRTNEVAGSLQAP